ncbi:MAG: aminotransferase class V-fold PLP-dependent enzyme [Gemmatimonadota bacterium]|nr:aminotransferase class V-fold PLP-dependent enzyme [Gemmatimonadota bacterium]
MTELPNSPATWTAEEIRRVGYRAVDLIVEHLASTRERPVFSAFPRGLAEFMAQQPLPDIGQSADEVLSDFARDVAPFPFGNGHPRFYGWVNSPPTPIGVFAEALAAAMNPSVAGGNHAAVHVERQVVSWMKALVGFPAEGMGLLVSGASVATLTGLAVARHVALAKRGRSVREHGLQSGDGALVVYKGAEGHGCSQKAVELLGIGSANLRVIESDADLRLVPAALDAAIRADLAAGRIPMAVVASAGTVNTGAIDPINAIADICAEHGVWLHVDGAYGAPAIITAQYRAALAPIARADSLAVDPHKWLYVPVEAGLVLVRNATAMRDAFSLVPPYLRIDGDEHGVLGPPWFSEFGIQQTRGFKALKVWMSLKHYGVNGYRAMIENDLTLAAHLATTVDEADDFERLTPSGLSIVCFRYAPLALRGDEKHLDELNRKVLAEMQLGGEAFVSSTVIRGRFWLRACIVNHRATVHDIEIMVDVVRRIGTHLTS